MSFFSGMHPLISTGDAIVHTTVLIVAVAFVLGVEGLRTFQHAVAGMRTPPPGLYVNPSENVTFRIVCVFGSVGRSLVREEQLINPPSLPRFYCA